MSLNYRAPIVLFCYNRPNHLKQVVESLQNNSLAKESDLIIGYRDNQMQSRLFFRLIISYIFRVVMVALFGYDIKDYHGVPIYPVKITKKLNIISNGYPFQVETLVKLLRHEVSYIEVPFSINNEKHGNSKVIRLKSFYDFFKTIWHLLRT